MSTATRPREPIVVFSENDFDREFLARAIEQYFSDYLEVVPLSSRTCDGYDGSPKAVMANIVALESARRRFPTSELVFSQRVISGYNLERIIELPAGTHALVVTKPREMAIDTVQNLLSLGVDHLVLEPYWPECETDITGFDTVIYTGFRNYCPEGKKEYINIDYRNFSQSALARIIKIYDLPPECLDTSYHRHVRLIVEGLYKTQDALREARTLQQNFEQVCVLSANALLNLDPDDNIVVINPAAEQLLGLSRQEVLGRGYQDCLDGFDALRQLITRRAEVTDQLIYLRSHPVLATLRVSHIDRRPYLMLSLTPVESLLGTEEKARVDLYKRGFVAKHTFDDLQGQSARFARAVKTARYLSRTEAAVLITGESGTGKELFAQSIHNASARARGPFVGVNFAAISETLIESELFGYDEGAFTGAVKGGKQGLFRSAHRGTIFLDEIGDISCSMQSRLLRVLEEREIMPVGSARVIPIDVRIICATNKDLPRMVAEGRFREDLYYRLKVFTLPIPPLRERREDIPVILRSILGDDALLERIPAAVWRRFTEYDWPGNIRELKSIAEHLTLFFGDEPDDAEEAAFRDGIIQAFFSQETSEPPAHDGLLPSPDDLLLLRCVASMNREHRSAGRYSLSKLPELQARSITESVIKRMLKRLEADGLLLCGRTRQGVTLTERGRRALGEEA